MTDNQKPLVYIHSANWNILFVPGAKHKKLPKCEGGHQVLLTDKAEEIAKRCNEYNTLRQQNEALVEAIEKIAKAHGRMKCNPSQECKQCYGDQLHSEVQQAIARVKNIKKAKGE
jgi:hypothetical protein